MTRLEVANLLKENIIRYYVPKCYGIFLELGLNRGGKLRADAIALNRKGEIILFEIKSCWQDFKTDSKMGKYIPYCNKAYLVVTAELWATKKNEIKELLPDEMGVIVDGSKFVVKTSYRPMQGSVKKDIILRTAWRSATYSLRTHTKRKLRDKTKGIL